LGVRTNFGAVGFIADEEWGSFRGAGTGSFSGVTCNWLCKGEGLCKLLAGRVSREARRGGGVRPGAASALVGVLRRRGMPERIGAGSGDVTPMTIGLDIRFDCWAAKSKAYDQTELSHALARDCRGRRELWIGRGLSVGH
jgi:hypothetical protein